MQKQSSNISALYSSWSEIEERDRERVQLKNGYRRYILHNVTPTISTPYIHYMYIYTY